VVIALVGNKSDSATLATYKRKVTLNDAKKFAEENNLIFVGESSAQMNVNVNEVFDALYESKINDYNYLFRNCSCTIRINR
jgi:hypothetical protein